MPGNTKYRVPGNKSVKPYVFTDNALAFVSAQSKAPDHAWELLKLLVEPETFLEFNRLRGRLPPRQSLWTKGFMADKKVQEIAGWSFAAPSLLERLRVEDGPMRRVVVLANPMSEEDAVLRQPLQDEVHSKAVYLVGAA